MYSDTPQFRGGNPYFFNENPYQSVSFIYASMYRENVHAIHIAMQFANKLRHCVGPNKSRQPAAKNQNRSFTSRGATVGLRLRLCCQSCSTGDEISRFSEILREKLVVSTMKLFCSAIHIHKLFFSNLPQIRITT